VQGDTTRRGRGGVSADKKGRARDILIVTTALDWGEVNLCHRRRKGYRKYQKEEEETRIAEQLFPHQVCESGRYGGAALLEEGKRKFPLTLAKIGIGGLPHSVHLEQIKR